MIKAWSYIDEYKDLRKKILKSIDATLKSGQIFFGKELIKFEKKFIKINNFRYGAAVGSCTEALYISLLALGIGRNDEVITVSNTAIPTVSAIKTSGAKIKFVDIGKDYLINVNKIEKIITKKTKATIQVVFKISFKVFAILITLVSFSLGYKGREKIPFAIFSVTGKAFFFVRIVLL